MTLNRRFALVAAVGAALVVSSVALAAGGVAGTYTATIKNSGHLNGKWVVVLKGGTYTVAHEREHSRSREVHGDRDDDHVRSRARSGCAGAGVLRLEEVGEDHHLRPQARARLLPGTRRGAGASVHGGEVARTR